MHGSVLALGSGGVENSLAELQFSLMANVRHSLISEMLQCENLCLQMNDRAHFCQLPVTNKEIEAQRGEAAYLNV